MKTKIKRHSRAVLSIVLTLCMLVSCMTVGIIATDAAKVTNSDKAIGAKADDETIGAKADDGEESIGAKSKDDGESLGAADESESVGETGHTIYMCPDNLGYGSYSYFKVWVKDNGGNQGQKDYSVAMNKYSKTIDGKDIYTATIYEYYGGWSYIQFWPCDSSWNKLDHYDVTNGTWVYASGIQDKVYNGYSNNTHHWDTPSWDRDDVYVTGTFNSWNTSTTKMTCVGTNDYTVTVNLTSSDQFKFYVDGYNQKYWGHGTAGYSISESEWGSDLNYANGGQNINAPSTAGEYILHFDPDAKKAYAVLVTPAVTDDYYLAGQYGDGTAGFFGTAWATKLSGNKMTYNSTTGKYEKKYTSGISGGTIQFKVVKNGDWDEGSYPAENQTYKVNSDSTWVNFEFDPDTEKITVTQDGTGGGGTPSGWLYSGTAAASRTEVNPSEGYTTFDSTQTGNSQYGKFRYMYGSSDTGLNTALEPSSYKTGSSYNEYWADITSISKSNSSLFIGLCNYSNKGNMVGNNSEYINGSSVSDGNDVTIKDTNNKTLFKIQRKQNNDVSSSARYIFIRDVDWTLVDSIGIQAYDYSKSTNNSNTHSGRVDYRLYYKAKAATPVEETKVVDIYAKDACLRDDTFNRFAGLADTVIDQTYFEYSETNASTGAVTTYTSITDYNAAHSSKQIVYTTYTTAYGTNGNGAGYVKMTNVPVGAKVKIKTTLSSSTSTAGSFNSKAFKDTHYLKAYSFNGMSYQVNSYESDGVYEETWTVRAVNTTYTDSNGILQNATTEGKAVEVTPIYYLKDNSNCKTFLIDGYDGEVQNAWGNMLAVYPYYEGKNNKDNAFGGYPGQPMLLWGGKYQMEIPLTVDGTATGSTVKGLTLHNGYWDLLHRTIDIRCNNRNHAQTYDYDDFYKLYKEKNPDTIIFDFKYRTTKDNYNDGYQYIKYDFADGTTEAASTYAGSSYNGVEIITDYFGRQVDVFGNLLTDAQKSDYDSSHPQDKELLIVSTGYKDTYVGEYATLWAVYAPQSSIPSGSNDTAGKFIGYISSSMLYLNNWDRRLQYTGGDSTADGRMSWSQFQTTYNHLKTYYKGVPALISYEKEIWNDSKDKAYRSDGKWYYSNKSDKISASIKIQYGSYTLLDAPDHSVSSSAWRDDPFDDSAVGIGGVKNIGTTTKCSAYFTNTSPNLLGKVDSGEQFADSTKKFTFEAVPSGAYMFAGWVRYSNGKYYEITENEIGESPMSANDVYIARFVDAQTGTLTVQHVVEQTGTYTGTGTPAVTVTVKNGNTTVETFTNSTVGEKLDISKYIDSHFKTYTIDISLTTTPTNESYMSEILSSSGNFAASPSSWSGTSQTSATTATVAQFTVQDVLDSGVTSLRYVSHLQKPTYTYQYQITYYYNSRFWGQQSYTVTGEFADDNDFAANTTGSKTTAKLNTDFIINKTPYEKNFREKIQWNYTDSAVTIDGKTANAMQNNSATLVTGTTYKMTAKVYSANEIDDMVRAEIILPYTWDFSQESGYTNKGTDMYNSSGNKLSDTECVYDASVEGPTLETMLYKLFTYNEKNSASDYKTGSDNLEPHKLKLIEAAPYVVKDGTTDATKIQYHKTEETKNRYFTSTKVINGVTYKYFTVNNVNYYYGAKPDTDATGVLVTDTAQFTVPYHGETHHYAVLDSVKDELYTFDDATAAEKGQYRWFYRGDTIDGVVQNTGVKKYFTRWDIYNSKGEFVASSYNRYFNYSGYDNYVVKAIYESDTEVPVEYDSVKPISSAITYLDDSRNQWNNDSGESGSGNYASVTHQDDLEDADKLFTDFAISYSYYGKNINTISNITTDPTNGANIKVGMIIERLDVLDTSGGKYITSASHYADKYKGDTGWQNLAGCLDGRTSGTLTSAVTNGHKCYNSKIGANYTVDGYTPFGTVAPGANPSQTSVIDNFNRLQWFYTINNFGTASDMKKYAYRAVSYIVVEDRTGTHAYLCDAPTYFTIYDTATRVGY